MTLFWGLRISSLYNQLEAYYLAQNKTVEFVNGEIVNMPLSHKELEFKGLPIYVDRKYTDKQAVAEDIGEAKSTALYIGPRAAYMVSKGKPQEIPYPPAFNKKIDAAYLEQVKTMLLIAVFLGGIIIWFVFKFIESMLYILIIIAPILLFKFRRMGLTYGEGFKTGFYLVSYQLILSTVLIIIGFTYLWIPLLFVLFYVFFIGGFVNIDLTQSKRQLSQNTGSQ